jgi:two-component system nitrate/nitrite response regulator NarL
MRDLVRVLVVDDHEMFSEALALLFRTQSDIELIARAQDAEEGIEVAARERPDVVLMDLDLPGMDGIEATKRVRAVSPESKVLILTAIQATTVVSSALAAGACGYVPKTRAVEELLDLIHRAAADEIVMPAAHLPLVIEQLESGREPTPVTDLALRRLTAREKEILHALAAGDATTTIAESLGISPLTVQSHVKNILSKLGVHSRIEAVTLALRHRAQLVPRAKRPVRG